MDLKELAEEYAKQLENRKTAAAWESEAKEKMAAIEQQLIEALADCGWQNIKMADGLVLYRKVDRIYCMAKGVDKTQFIEELARHPQTMDLVSPNYNSQSFQARMKNIERNGEALPSGLAEMVTVIEKDRIGHR